MSFLSRYASKVVQKAHARVTAENARYVKEAIERDATIERLTQERDAAKAAFEAEARANTELEEALRERDAELLDTQGRLATAEERLAFIDREEDMRDEVRAKRASDL